MYGLAQGNCGVWYVLDDVDPTGCCGDIMRLVVLVCVSPLGVGSSFGHHVNYFLQLFSAVSFKVVRLVLEGVW